jgi:protein SCO1/2
MDDSSIMRSRLGRLGTLLATIALAAGVAAHEVSRDEAPPQDVDGRFSLVEQHGRPVTDQSFRGDFMLVYFGFASCPDVCPLDLATMAAALRDLGTLAGRIHPIFITIDPSRDTPERLAAYVAAFDPRMLGLTGTPEQIRSAASAYGVDYTIEESNGEHLVDQHTAFTYLMGPDGQFLRAFPHGVTGSELADALRSALASG